MGHSEPDSPAMEIDEDGSDLEVEDAESGSDLEVEDAESGSDLEQQNEGGSDVEQQDENGSDFEQQDGKVVKIKKEPKAGIIYLSCLPPGMNVKQIRDYFSAFGEVNRSFLQPEKKKWKGRGKPKNQTFIEGWIEFRKRRHAKRVAATLNTCPVGGKKKKVYHDFLWNIKYLPGFQWVHLNERLAYERISMKQKIRTEISAAKRETDFFSRNIDLSKKLKRKGILGSTKKVNASEESAESGPTTTNSEEASQNNTKIPVSDSKKSKTSKVESTNEDRPASKPKAPPGDRSAFLKSLFSSS